MRRIIFVFALLGGCLAPAADSVATLQATVESSLMPAIQAAGQPPKHWRIEDRMKALHVRGVSVAVIEDYKIAWAKGYGILDDTTGKAVNTETLFQAGSISKPVAVTGAMRLIELGKLNLDEDVNVKLKSWKVPDNEFTKEAKVTLRRTMSHSAGLTVHGFPGYEAGAPIPTLPQILDGIKPANTAPVRVDVVPGTLGRYSGGGTTIMQLLMTDVTGRDFPALLRELVLEKAGMEHSTYEQPVPQDRRGNTASGYYSSGKPVAGRYHTYPEMAAAGLWTTASDLARFAIEMGLSRQGKANHILRQETVEQMMTVQKDGFGLGFALEDDHGNRRFGHGGADEGFQAVLTCSFNGQGAAIMVNSDNGVRLADEIVRAISATYHWPDKKPTERTIVALTPAQQAAYAGTYEAPFGKVEVRPAGDHLRLHVSTGMEFELHASDPADTFYQMESGNKVTFTRAADGKVASLALGNNVARKTR